MTIYPDLKTVKGYAAEYDIVPVMAEMMADMLTPVNLFMSIKNKYENSFLLESAENGSQFGRYSFIGVEPDLKIQFSSGVMTINDSEKIETMNPIDEIEKILETRKSPKIGELPKFTGGLIGYFGYDTVRYVEKTVSNCNKDDIHIPEISLMGCSNIIVFDHFKHNILLISNIETKGDIEKNYEDAKMKLRKIYDEIQYPEIKPVLKKKREMKITTALTKEKFCENIDRAIEYIRDGDIFQVVLSQRFNVENPPEAFNVYRMLRTGNPSPYMYYFNFGSFEIAGSSPEMLVSVEDRKAVTHPIAGTIRRGKNKAEDNELKKILLNDKKELAEHTMLVDLGRNDIGKISKFGTVNVERFMEIGEYSKLMHIVSRVSGDLRDELKPLDALRACLPAGTLSGAPKVRAMQIIDELEENKRNLYGGAIGYIGYNQVMDTCIAIRTALFKDNMAYVQAGGGIVADSVSEKEYEEAKTKASAVLTAIEKAGELN